jgi:hypothetical protein
MILNSWIDSSVGVESSVMFEPTSTFDTPSTSQLSALRRAPFTERLTVLVRPTPTSSLRSLDTPGASVASCKKLRLLSGSSCTCAAPTRLWTAAVFWTNCAPAVTSMVSATPPTPSLPLISSRSLTDSWMPFTMSGWIPLSENVISYEPTGSSGAV